MTNEKIVENIKNGINPSENMELLYSQNMGFIISVVSRYKFICEETRMSTSVIEFDDLKQEAYFGLYEAVKRYDNSQGVMFLTYAEHWIRQSITRFLDNCGRTIRVSVHMQQRIYQYNQVSSYFLRNYGREATTEEFAEHLGIPKKKVAALENFMFQRNVQSLDAPLEGAEDEELTMGSIVAANDNTADKVINSIADRELRCKLWESASRVLNQKMLRLLKYRYMNKLTLKEAGNKMGITMDAARNIEFKTLRRLRNDSRTKHLYGDFIISA